MPRITHVTEMKQTYRIGIDIGSTTLKAVVLDENEEVVFSSYERHNARIVAKLTETLHAIAQQTGDAEAVVRLTGSVGMGIAEKCGLPFVQEVVAATNYVRRKHGEAATMIDIGGEDAKVVLFRNGKATDLRMNGNCAGGTGAFIDQMAILLNVPTEELNTLAMQATQVYPIASRCGVFSKTDIQNLIARNVSKADIAASVFHAVTVQVIVTLAHGCEINPPVLFCGGPLTFLPALRKAFADYLHLTKKGIIVPEKSHLLPAWGTALSEESAEVTTLHALTERLQQRLSVSYRPVQGLAPIFENHDEYEAWRAQLARFGFKRKALAPGHEEVTLGIDSGSTTTKIVVLNKQNELLYTYYRNNGGDPIATVEEGLKEFRDACREAGTEVRVCGSCSTGYGEDLIKAAFRLNGGIIETIAHYMAARYITPDVSFILDIGGQDMKAMFVTGGIINRIEINEACSSGCGSFIETFAKSLGYTVEEFAQEACRATHPYDLGTRCTVFMNSKVKQALREGATVADIAAGLSYSVIKNCLYKVLRLKNTEELGTHIVVQGGTMKNDSVVRAFEKLVGRKVFRSDCPELMGAAGCALYARQTASGSVSLDELLSQSSYTTAQRQCKGCENRCNITLYRFAGGGQYYSGNRCEKYFSNRGERQKTGVNVYTEKLRLLFDRPSETAHPVAVIGIPRCLNMYEEYPFWHTLFTRCHMQVVLSAPSTFNAYEAKARLVMSDNICFPAKLVHSHIQNLTDRKVERIFMPFVVYEKQEGGQNSYNCPIVSGYSEVVKSVQQGTIPVDAPAINFKDKGLLYKQCRSYLRGLGVDERTIKKAFEEAVQEEERFRQQLEEINRQVWQQGARDGMLTILLAGRPYHTDPLIQHKLSDTIAAMGVNVITEDIARSASVPMDDVHFVSQWAYANRILKAAKWVALQGNDVQCMQMTSFGCGPDAFLTDETRSLLKRYGKTLTLLKIDDISNTGSLRLRVRSAIESLKLSLKEKNTAGVEPFVTTPPFEKQDRRRKMIAPFFTPYLSPLIPPLMKLNGYEVDILPVSDAASCDWGLRYANNEVCYPATLIVGDIVKAFKEGRYAPQDTVVGITQTGGQCRASSYISLIKKALTESGYGDVPVISLTIGSKSMGSSQPGFRMNWFKLLPILIDALLYSDCIAKFYNAAVVRETTPGAAEKLMKKYLEVAKGIIERNASHALQAYIVQAARDFNRITRNMETPKVGVVGEIFLKFNPFAQKDVCGWLADRGIEVVPPLLTEFFVQTFVNRSVNQKNGLKRKVMPEKLIRGLYGWIWKRMERYNCLAGEFQYFTPFRNVFDEAAEAEKVISLNAQFGEGWMLPGEILSLAAQGVNHIVSLQPFGCIANHIVSKGIENRIRQIYPDLQLLSLDFDSGVSDVNVTNRLLLFTDSLQPQPQKAASRTA